MFPPELFVLVGVNIFVLLSLLSSIFDKHFPAATPFVFHIAALAGFGQIWVNFMFLFNYLEARFLCGMLYLLIGVVAVAKVNLYLAVNKRLKNAAVAMLGAFTIPSFSTFFFLASAYLNGLTVWTPPFPVVPFEAIYVVFALCLVILGLSIIIHFKPSILVKLSIRKRGHRHSLKTHQLNVSPTDDISHEIRGR